MFDAVWADTVLVDYFFTSEHLLLFIIVFFRSTVFICDYVLIPLWQLQWFSGVLLASRRVLPFSNSRPRVFRKNLWLIVTKVVWHTCELSSFTLVVTQYVRTQMFLNRWCLNSNIHHSRSDRFGWVFTDEGAELLEGLLNQIMFSLLIFSEILQFIVQIF